MVKLRRVYDPVSRTDGARFLVERLWPRGLSKERLRLTAWLKEVGPSTDLRKWFNHDPTKWSRFRTRYFRELDARGCAAHAQRAFQGAVGRIGKAEASASRFAGRRDGDGVCRLETEYPSLRRAVTGDVGAMGFTSRIHSSAER